VEWKGQIRVIETLSSEEGKETEGEKECQSRTSRIHTVHLVKRKRLSEEKCKGVSQRQRPQGQNLQAPVASGRCLSSAVFSRPHFADGAVAEMWPVLHLRLLESSRRQSHLAALSCYLRSSAALLGLLREHRGKETVRWAEDQGGYSTAQRAHE